MKQQYKVIKDVTENKLVLQEYGELDKDVMSLLCQETFEGDAVRAALGKGKTAVMSALRTPNMYPPNTYAALIADAVIRVYDDEAVTEEELVFDDTAFLVREREARDLGPIEDEESDLDDLLTDDDEDELGTELVDDEDIPAIGSNTSIQIADEDALDIEDEA